MANPIKSVADEVILNNMIGGEPNTRENYSTPHLNRKGHAKIRAKNKAAKKARRKNR